MSGAGGYPDPEKEGIERTRIANRISNKGGRIHPQPCIGLATATSTPTTTTLISQAQRDSGRAAILLLGFQNEYVKKGGILHSDVTDVMGITGVLENVPKLVDFSRKLNAMIIYSPVVMNESGQFTSASSVLFQARTAVPFDDLFEVEKPEYPARRGSFTENTWNCEIAHEVEPRNDDIVLQDRCDHNAFEGTKLISELSDNNIKHLFVA